jgi:hypothetical protein
VKCSEKTNKSKVKYALTDRIMNTANIEDYLQKRLRTRNNLQLTSKRQRTR